MTSPLYNKRLLFIITGGIAAYKSLELIRLLKREGVNVTPVMTTSAEAFVTPLSVAGVAGEKVHQDLLTMTAETEMGHIALSRQADLVVICPATANTLAKMTAGIADDLATTLLLATDTPVLAIPAMNVRMWEHPATVTNCATLKSRGVEIMPPAVGDMACGEYGAGRLPEPGQIVQYLHGYFGADKPLAGKKALVTCGGTREAIDPVRYLSNRSSGKQGHAIAAALRDAGATVTLIQGQVQDETPAHMAVVPALTAEAMHTATQQAIAENPTDIAVFVAAVSDWQPKNPASSKQKKTSGQETFTLELVKTPDILATAAKPGDNRPKLVIGFAAETDNEIAHAIEKYNKKNCDWLVLNKITKDNPAFGVGSNQVSFIAKDADGDAAIDTWPTMPKRDVALKLVDRIVNHFDDLKNSSK